jgi:hypothetical protein
MARLRIPGWKTGGHGYLLTLNPNSEVMAVGLRLVWSYGCRFGLLKM